VIEYDDVAGRTYRTHVTFDPGHNAYTSILGGPKDGGRLADD
jgi:hypothetical protein